ncbi:MAG: DUF2066 domain-containing protein [Hyphomonadaceae bacterium]
MKATPLAAVAALFMAALCAFAPAPASAQTGRDNVFAVSGVYVDVQAADAAQAQQAGFAEAQRLGFERLVRRLTLPEEVQRQGMPAAVGNELDQLVSSVEVENERRSGTRYIGRLTVRFDPSGVRSLLRRQNFTVVDTRTAPVLVAPLAAPDTAPETVELWRAVWAEGGFEQELAPLTTAPAGLAGTPDWNTAAPFAQASAAASALYATLRVQGQSASASLVEVAPNGVRRDRGEVSARIAAADPSAVRIALASLAEQASQRIQTDWKARIATGTGQRARVSASALYSDQRQWEQIKSALEGAAATLISEIRIEAVGREGALVSFSFVGDRNQLAAELGRRNVTLEESAMGPVLRVRR